MITAGSVSAQFKTLKDYTAFVDWDMNPINGVKSKTPTGYILQYSSAKGWNLDQLKEVSGECRTFLEKNGLSLSNPTSIESDIYPYGCELLSILMGECEGLTFDCDEDLRMAWSIKENGNTKYFVTFQLSDGAVAFSVDKTSK